MAIECCSTLSIAEVLRENLTAYEEIRLYRTCHEIHNGNQARREWWQHMENMIQATMSESSQTLGDINAPLPSILSLENIAEHNRNMRDTRRLHHMPGTAFEQQWLNYIHRGPLSEYEHNNHGNHSFSWSYTYDSILSHAEESSFTASMFWDMGRFGPRGGPPCEQCMELPSVNQCKVPGLLCNRCLQGSMNKQKTVWWAAIYRGHPVLSDPIIMQPIAEYVWGNGLDVYCHCGQCKPRWFLHGWICWPIRKRGGVQTTIYQRSTGATQESQRDPVD